MDERSRVRNQPSPPSVIFLLTNHIFTDELGFKAFAHNRREEETKRKRGCVEEGVWCQEILDEGDCRDGDGGTSNTRLLIRV